MIMSVATQRAAIAAIPIEMEEMMMRASGSLYELDAMVEARLLGFVGV